MISFYNGDKNRYFAMSTSSSPTPDDYDQLIHFNSTEMGNEYSMNISPEDTYYCKNCMILFSTGLDEEEKSKPLRNNPLPAFVSQTLLLSIHCNSKECSTCSPGYDPSSFCKSCLDNHYGTNCTSCAHCLYGHCDDTIQGTYIEDIVVISTSGQCLCDERHQGSKCTDCKDGFYGLKCQKCPYCNVGSCDV